MEWNELAWVDWGLTGCLDKVGRQETPSTVDGAGGRQGKGYKGPQEF